VLLASLPHPGYRVHTMKMTCRTHVGLVRRNNEDCVHIDESGQFAVLADGMGGLLAGEEASAVAVSAVIQGFAKDPRSGLSEIVLGAHSAVQAHAHQMSYVGKMGTTLAIWSWHQGEAQYCHVGDSRVYSFCHGVLTQISCDHTVAQRMVDIGTIPKERAHLAPNQNVLTQAIGLPGTCNPEFGTTPQRGRLLLCSDGLSDLVRKDALQALLAIEDIDTCADELVMAALSEGGRDNISVALIDIE